MPALRILTPQTRDIGFPVRRLLPAAAQRSVGPFVFLDHMGPATFAPDSTEGDVRPHPHIGLATITYLFSGAIVHRDSLGVVQRIEPGAVNWMCAGRGVVHSERMPEDVRRNGDLVEGIQMWVALPAALEACEPQFLHYPAESLPQWEEAGAQWHLLIGHWGRHSSPVEQPSETFYASGKLAAQACFRFPSEVAERALYVVHGALQIGDQQVQAGSLAILDADFDAEILATEASCLMLLGGAPLDAPRQMWWNFVSTSRERIEEANADWVAERFPVVPGEHERIPAPPLLKSH
ncbi:pirin family protein [Uliginosibacterium sediminicola]|uniref:Pirin family protein n=1 Tax=Uliginosibacterium sediminicola TaxID=2024550 RepID=A0ABU9YZX5_9RHOO